MERTQGEIKTSTSICDGRLPRTETLMVEGRLIFHLQLRWFKTTLMQLQGNPSLNASKQGSHVWLKDFPQDAIIDLRLGKTEA